MLLRIKIAAYFKKQLAVGVSALNLESSTWLSAEINDVLLSSSCRSAAVFDAIYKENIGFEEINFYK